MAKIRWYMEQTITYQVALMILKHLKEFLETFGDISYRFVQTLKYLFTLQINYKQVI